MSFSRHNLAIGNIAAWHFGHRVAQWLQSLRFIGSMPLSMSLLLLPHTVVGCSNVVPCIEVPFVEKPSAAITETNPLQPPTTGLAKGEVLRIGDLCIAPSDCYGSNTKLAQHLTCGCNREDPMLCAGPRCCIDSDRPGAPSCHNKDDCCGTRVCNGTKVCVSP